MLAMRPGKGIRSLRSLPLPLPDSLLQHHISRCILRIKPHHNLFLAAGGNITSDKISPDRQFPVATVDQHRQLDAGWPAMVHERVKRRPDGAAGKEHIV